MRHRLATSTGLALAVACLAAPGALAAAPGPPPLQAGRYDGRSPDTKDAALAAHHGGRALSTTRVVFVRPPLNGLGYDGRSPDTKDAAFAAHHTSRTTALAITKAASQPAATTVVDGRSPDTKDAALAAHNAAATVVVATAGGFDWTDAGIGAAAGFGLAVMLGASLTLTRKKTTAAAS